MLSVSSVSSVLRIANQRLLYRRHCSRNFKWKTTAVAAPHSAGRPPFCFFSLSRWNKNTKKKKKWKQKMKSNEYSEPLTFDLPPASIAAASLVFLFHFILFYFFEYLCFFVFFLVYFCLFYFCFVVVFFMGSAVFLDSLPFLVRFLATLPRFYGV